ncbi:DMT family transporter [Brachybacterium halotolerans]|uniref:DMT family transporter n=1 Tax=Brachybacterium halotolerans TaxID=2795215 RepID=UPI002B1E38FE|nr:multidrug efflux SMR transporter [Brachybacterium halotolerans]
MAEESATSGATSDATSDAASDVTSGATSRGWMFLLLAIGTEVTASLSLKGALEQPALYAVVLIGYLGAFIALALVLREGMPLGVAYGVWGASGVALTAMMSLVLFGEPLTAPMIIGIVLVIAGVLCVELGSPAQPASGVGPESGVGLESGVPGGQLDGAIGNTTQDGER